MSKTKELLTEEFLTSEYLKQRKPMHQIAEENGVSVGSVYNYLKKFNIDTRQQLTDEAKRKISESQKGKPSKIKGRKKSEEARKKISEAKKGKFKVISRYGGHTKNRSDGYVAVYIPTHPSASKDGYVMEHILVMEEHIGRHLADDEVVHHKNKIRNDNRIENLQLMTFREHSGLHMKERHEQKKGVMTYQ